MENNLEQQLSAILSDPAMMSRIQSLAQSLGQQSAPGGESSHQDSNPSVPDPGTLQALTGLAGNTAVDPDQRALLSALSPYLSRDRVSKLENAMRAAKMARLASTFLGNGGAQLLTGR